MAILVDSSYWIYLFKPGSKKVNLDEEFFNEFHTCPPIIQEILQGIKTSSTAGIEFNEFFLAQKCLASPVDLEFYIEAANIYQLGRKLGYTIRSSIDCLIAAIAIKNNLPVLHKDRDFSNISKFTELKQFERLLTSSIQGA